jgi:hypothetical protein
MSILMIIPHYRLPLRGKVSPPLAVTDEEFLLNNFTSALPRPFGRGGIALAMTKRFFILK